VHLQRDAGLHLGFNINYHSYLFAILILIIVNYK